VVFGCLGRRDWRIPRATVSRFWVLRRGPGNYTVFNSDLLSRFSVLIRRARLLHQDPPPRKPSPSHDQNPPPLSFLQYPRIPPAPFLWLSCLVFHTGVWGIVLIRYYSLFLFPFLVVEPPLSLQPHLRKLRPNLWYCPPTGISQSKESLFNFATVWRDVEFILFSRSSLPCQRSCTILCAYTSWI